MINIMTAAVYATRTVTAKTLEKHAEQTNFTHAILLPECQLESGVAKTFMHLLINNLVHRCGACCCEDAEKTCRQRARCEVRVFERSIIGPLRVDILLNEWQARNATASG